MQHETILKKTRAVNCETNELELCNAKIVYAEDKIFLEKEINERILLSNFGKHDFPLFKLFFDLKLSGRHKTLEKAMLFYITLRCNLNCAMCSSAANIGNFKELSLKEIEFFFNNKSYKNKGWKISLFGGEPTVRKDLFEIIKILKKSGNYPYIFTNGLLLAKDDYVKKLYNSGLCGVDLSFSSFSDEFYLKHRGAKLKDKKQEILLNLYKNKLPVNIECVVIKGDNEKEVIDMFNYSLSDLNVNSLVLRPYNILGRKGVSSLKSLMPTDIVDLLEKQTAGLITKEMVCDFQKVLYVISDIFNLKICLYNKYYLVLRKNMKPQIPNEIFDKIISKKTEKNSIKYLTIHDVFPLKYLSKQVKKYVKLRRKSKIIAKSYFLILLIFSTIMNLNKYVVQILFENIKIIFTNNVQTNKMILPIKFTMNCDTHVFCEEVSKNCTMQQYRSDIGIKTSAYMNLANERILNKKFKKQYN
jgi:MoaA/NifB/PqqE/SkfB family radical SAM enzyme